MRFWDAATRVLSWPSGERRFEVLPGTVGLEGLNDPGQSMYQALVGALDGMSSASVPGLPAVGMDSLGQNSAMYLAIALTCSTIAGLPLHTLREDANGRLRKERLPEYRFLWRRPNAEETRQEFFETAFAHRMVGGDTFLYVMRDRLGRPVELHSIYPRRVQVGRDRSTLRKVYTIDGNDEAPLVSANQFEGEMVHVRNLTWRRNGMRGLGLADIARLGLQTTAAAEQYGARFFSQGSAPGGVLTSDQVIEDDMAERLSKRWDKYHRGYSRSHGIAVMGSGTKYQSTMVSPEDAQALLVRGFEVKEIARWTGTPPHLLMDPTGSTSWGSGLEEQNRAFVVYTLSRASRGVEQAISDQLMADTEAVKWNYDALLRGSTLQRYQAYQVARVCGFLSNNDIREFEDWDEIDPADPSYSQPLNSNTSGASPAGEAASQGGDLSAQIDELRRRLDELGAQ